MFFQTYYLELPGIHDVIIVVIIVIISVIISVIIINVKDIDLSSFYLLTSKRHHLNRKHES